jgi:hypothetical protein
MKPKSVSVTVKIDPEDRKILDREAGRLVREGERLPLGLLITAIIEFFEDTERWDDVNDIAQVAIEDAISERKRKDRERKRRG